MQPTRNGCSRCTATATRAGAAASPCTSGRPRPRPRRRPRARRRHGPGRPGARRMQPRRRRQARQPAAAARHHGRRARHRMCRLRQAEYHYAARTCEICGAHYHPSGKTVRTCGRACGVQLRRRVYGNAGGAVAKPRPPCAVCGEPCNDLRGKFCSKACSGVAQSVPRQTPIAYYTCRYCGKLGVMNANMRQQREVCPARECQLTRLAANRLITRKGMTREQAHAAVTAYRAEGDHRQAQRTPEQQAADRRWSQTVTAVKRATERTSRQW